MKKILFIIISSFFISCAVEHKMTPVLFNATQSRRYSSYLAQMNIPINHEPSWYGGINIYQNWFVFRDSSYIYYKREGGFNPNIERMKNSKKEIEQCYTTDSLKYYTYIGNYTFILSCEGVDSNGLYWKNINYLLIKDSTYIYNHENETIPWHLGGMYSSSIGYARVSSKRKYLFDKSMESFKLIEVKSMQIRDSIMNKNNMYRPRGARIRYLEDTANIVIKAPDIDMYEESFCK